MSSKNDIAICVFGSHSRGSKDEFSDKDVLICGPSRGESCKLINDWEANNWSVAFYTWKRLDQMSKAGSLFLQHLKQEGDILHDGSSRLKNALQKYQPKESYHGDLRRSLELCRPTEREMASSQAAACMGDILYTFARNAMILQLASRKIYIFDYSKLLEQLQILGLISKQEVGTLKTLRLLKAAYRSRNFTFLNEREVYTRSKSIIYKMFRLGTSEICAYSDIRYFGLPYATLRDIEVRLVSQFGISFLENSNDKTLKKIWRMIRDPRGYSWHTKRLTPEYTQDLSLFLRLPENADSA